MPYPKARKKAGGTKERRRIHIFRQHISETKRDGSPQGLHPFFDTEMMKAKKRPGAGTLHPEMKMEISGQHGSCVIRQWMTAPQGAGRFRK
ncbi:MAG: hypothetical protein LUE27_07975 [Clostridia bacterium]|nr:hypothetical protein [Clostridia bacterium]